MPQPCLHKSTVRGLIAFFCVSLVGLSGCNTQPAVPPAAVPHPSATKSAVQPSSTVPAKSLAETKPAAPAVRPRFVGVAADVGVKFTFYNDARPERFYYPEAMGSGVCWLDFDADGQLDLCLAQGCNLLPAAQQTGDLRTAFFRGQGHGQFRDVTLHTGGGQAGYGQGCAAGDFNADGFIDVFIAGFGADLLLQNNGDGTFTEVTRESGIDDPRWGSSALWLDVDRDGDLDLYVVNYLTVNPQSHHICQYVEGPGYCGPGAFEAEADALWLSDGAGQFREASAEWGLVGENGKGLAVLAVDLDDDLLPELYVANDMTPNFLFTRSGSQANAQPVYRDIAMSNGAAVSGSGLNEASMGIACADFDGDGRPDLVLTHYYRMKDTLYRNLGNLLFEDDSRRTKLSAESLETLGFGNYAGDYDRDGDPDLVFVNGHVLGPNILPQLMRPELLENRAGAFQNISDFAGEYFAAKHIGRGLAAGDFDNDGDFDLAVTHVGQPVALLQNETDTGTHRWIGIHLQTRNRVPPVGGRVVVSCGALRLVQPIVAGGSYLSQHDPRLLFGLGTETGPITVEVHWPSGEISRPESLAANQYWNIRDDRTVARPESQQR